MKSSIQDVIDKLMVPVETLDVTVDKLESGIPSTEVKGIIITFMVTQNVLQQAIEIGANLIITHEGSFYSHHGSTDWLENNSVYLEKQSLIEESGIAIYRFHDYIHRYQPDGIAEGLVNSMGWNEYVEENRPVATILNMPSVSVKEMAETIKRILSIPYVRIVGDLSMACTRVGLLVGYRGGGQLAIPLFEEENLDLVITGEGPEWETPEYVRDAAYQGRQKALIILGHAASEEPGMKYLAELVKGYFPTIPVTFIPEQQAFQVI